MASPYAVQAAQQDQPKTTPFVLHSTVQEVLLYCAVLDKHGQLVLDLDQAAFQVQENRRPASILHFDHEDVPVSIVLVLDDSGSMLEKRAAVQSAAFDLVRGSNPEDETAVMNFADTFYLDQDFTADTMKLQAALGASKTVSGGTALLDTVIAAANHLSAAAHHSKQVIVAVTDGRDNASGAELGTAIRRVQTANGPVIYTIGLLYDLPGGDARRARHDLQALSDETGGLAFFPPSVKEIDRVAAEVARDIRSQYTLAYRPPAGNSDTTFRTISVTAKNRKYGTMTVRTRKGYVRVDTPADQH